MILFNGTFFFSWQLYGFGLAIVGSIPTGAKLHNNLWQVVHTYVPLSPSTITWSWSNDGDVLRLGRWPQSWRNMMAAYRRGWLKKSPVDWFPVHRDQLRAHRSVTSYRRTFIYGVDLFHNRGSTFCRSATPLVVIIRLVQCNDRWFTQCANELLATAACGRHVSSAVCINVCLFVDRIEKTSNPLLTVAP